MLIFGEPGLEKSNIAALVHFGSPAHAAPLVQAQSLALTLDHMESHCHASSATVIRPQAPTIYIVRGSWGAVLAVFALSDGGS